MRPTSRTLLPPGHLMLLHKHTLQLSDLPDSFDVPVSVNVLYLNSCWTKGMVEQDLCILYLLRLTPQRNKRVAIVRSNASTLPQVPQ